MSETSQPLQPVLRDQLQGQLEEERERVREQLARLGHGRSAAGDAGDLDFDENFADSGQVTAERGEVEALSGQLTETLQDVEDALAKFDAGTYGACESCGEPIPEARLEAMPAARLCISCASQRR
jgi:RNA polymerase-binding transcription factor DksA